MKIRDLNINDYVIVYDLGKSEYSEGMTVVGRVFARSLDYACIKTATDDIYIISDNNYFDLWSNYIESKTESVSTPNPGKIYSYSNSTVGPNEEIISHSQSNDVQQRKRKDTVNHPSHYNYGDIAVLRANISRLERENRFLLSRKDNLFDSWRDENKRSVALSKRLEQLKRENEKLTSQGLREQCKEYAQDASKYTTLNNHIRMKAEHNPGVSRYLDLVNYIDRLERD